MDFRVFCDNKGCGKEMRPVIDKESKEVYCTECGKTVNNITVFMKNQMLSNGMVRKDEKRKLAYAVRCQNCNKEGPPELKNNKLICSFCGKELDKLAKPYAEMLKSQLKAQRRSDD